MEVNTSTAAYLSNLKVPFKFDETFDYDIYTQFEYPMLSQKGQTCVTDIIFTELFEADALRPFFAGTDWKSQVPVNVNLVSDPETCVLLPSVKENLIISFGKPNIKVPHKASRAIYSNVLAAAQERYLRMKQVNSKEEEVSFPRSSSISNTLWEKSHKPLSTAEDKEGLYFEDEVNFLGNLLVKNIMGIKDLPTFKLNTFTYKTPLNTSITKDNLVAVHLGIVYILENIGEFGHVISFFKGQGKWFLADDYAGYLHIINDIDWFENTFLPRLFYTIANPYVIEEPEKKVHIFRDDSLHEYGLMYHFLTPGADRSYPNIQYNTDARRVYLNSLLTISLPPPPPVTATGVTGGGSAVATVPISAKNAKIAEQTSALTAAIAAAMAKGKKTGGSRRKTRRHATKKRYTKKTSRRIK